MCPLIYDIAQFHCYVEWATEINLVCLVCDWSQYWSLTWGTGTNEISQNFRISKFLSALLESTGIGFSIPVSET
jgi:hypothetical protein